MDRLLLLMFFTPRVQCYSSGQIMESCNDMTPHHHGIKPQTESAPFSITADPSSYRLGEEVKVQLQASSSRPFIGFMLQAREVGGQSPVGSFKLILGGAQLLVCNQRPSSAVSHKSESRKTSIQVMWKADTSGDGKPIQFHASFVENFRTFWVDVPSLVLTYVNDTSLPTPPITTSTPQLPINELQPALQGTFSSADCGVTKLCFSQPPDCDPAVRADCYFMSAMRSSPTDAVTRYEMTGFSDGYISIGFSDDRIMGNDDIYICGRDTDGQVTLQRAYSTGRTAPQNSPLGNVSDLRAFINDGVIRCSFTSSEPISIRTVGFNKAYHLMFAHGPSSRGQIQFHTGTFISAVKVDISIPQIVGKARWPHIIKVHGALMLTAWMTTGSLGMIVARFLRGVTKGRHLMGKEIWFLIHIALMSMTVVVTIIAFILSFSYVKTCCEGAHSILGCLVMILSSLQSLLAFMRCGPQYPLRFLFNWSHAVNAVVIKTLAVAAIFIGLRMIDSAPNQWLMKVMGGFVGWEVLFYTLMEVYSKCRVSSTDTLKSNLISVILLIVLYSLGNLIFLVALLVGISMS